MRVDLNLELIIMPKRAARISIAIAQECPPLIVPRITTRDFGLIHNFHRRRRGSRSKFFPDFRSLTLERTLFLS